MGGSYGRDGVSRIDREQERKSQDRFIFLKTRLIL